MHEPTYSIIIIMYYTVQNIQGTNFHGFHSLFLIRACFCELYAEQYNLI